MVEVGEGIRFPPPYPLPITGLAKTQIAELDIHNYQRFKIPGAAENELEQLVPLALSFRSASRGEFPFPYLRRQIANLDNGSDTRIVGIVDDIFQLADVTWVRIPV